MIRIYSLALNSVNNAKVQRRGKRFSKSKRHHVYILNDTVKPVYNDHLWNKIYHLWFIQ